MSSIDEFGELSIGVIIVLGLAYMGIQFVDVINATQNEVETLFVILVAVMTMGVTFFVGLALQKLVRDSAGNYR